MCTAINDGNLFGRTLDIHKNYGEKVAIIPRNYKFDFLYEGIVTNRFAVIGVAYESGGVPLYYDAMNESGLCVAALNFPKNAVYHKPMKNKHNVASFEFIPWLLSSCDSVLEAVQKLEKANLTDDCFSPSLPATTLHWIVADKNGAITVESNAEGLKIYENPVGVLTNNPPFPFHISNIAQYMHLDSFYPENTLCPNVTLNKFGGGLGAVGLPGDFSPASRFVRAVFLKNHTTHEVDNKYEINRFFHIMNCVSVPKGCVKTEEGKDTFTAYTCCADRKNLTYYFKTYENPHLRNVSLTDRRINSDKIRFYDIG